MPRKLRVEYEGALYHVTCRLVGSWRDGDRELFRGDHDRWRILESLSERVEAYGVNLHQYVLMANHFHLVIETPQANCSAFMQSLLTSYTGYFNLRHGRHRHLFDGRFNAKLVQGDEYLPALSRYVHLNPLRVSELTDTAQRRKVLNDYYWSSYEFRDWVQDRYAQLVAGATHKEDVAFRPVEQALSPEVILARLAEVMECEPEQFRRRAHGQPHRPFAAYFLTRYGALSRRAAAPYMGVTSGPAVTQQLSRYRELIDDNRRMKKMAAACEAAVGEEARA